MGLLPAVTHQPTHQTDALDRKREHCYRWHGNSVFCAMSPESVVIGSPGVHTRIRVKSTRISRIAIGPAWVFVFSSRRKHLLSYISWEGVYVRALRAQHCYLFFIYNTASSLLVYSSIPCPNRASSPYKDGSKGVTKSHDNNLGARVKVIRK